MSGVRACPICGSGNAAASQRCWVCGASLTSAGPTAQVPRAVSSSGDALRAIGWLGLLLGIGFVTLLVAVELWIEWPGLLVPYALVVVIGFAALTRTAWLQTRQPSAAAPVSAAPSSAAPSSGAPQAPPRGPPPTGERSLAYDMALGVSIALLVIAGLALLAVAAVVIFFIICLAVIGGSGGFH